VSDKVQQALARIELARHGGLRIGASLGACLLPADDISSPSEAVRVADELMLAVKRAGKGSVLIHPASIARRDQA
jgi:GGDEF domain-containing protein